jgi:hypothetical protein
MIVGATSGETAIRSANPKMEVEMKTWYPTMSKADLKAIDSIYKSKAFEDENQRVTIAVGEAVFRCGVCLTLLIMSSFPSSIFHAQSAPSD